MSSTNPLPADAPAPAPAEPAPAPGDGPKPAAPAPAPTPNEQGHGHHAKGSFFGLALGALGIVYGDIGTSPLYAVAECFTKKQLPDGTWVTSPHALDVSHDAVLGILSLIFWSLMMVVTFKYLSFITRADNKGEGGTFALLALVPSKGKAAGRGAVVLAALFGASLLFGEGIITPAISVLSAVEGIGVATRAAEHFVVPIAFGILLALFLVQRRGTEKIGRAFGPVMVVWFSSIAALGLAAVLQRPDVLSSVDPRWAYRVFEKDPIHAFRVLGSVVLCITGGEALYADLGHFGAKPIRWSWVAVVCPALLMNYWGQGAYLLEHGWVEKPFWALVPSAFLYPMVVVATAAAVVASQALISGAFSLARQAVQLGFMPRVTVVHTSAKNEGQIYVPEVNQALMFACLALVVVFRESTALAAAYGIAVTGAMTITSIVFFYVVTHAWGWSYARALPLLLVFLAFDVPFFSANVLKFFDGGWFPIAVGLLMFSLMTTWKRGRAELALRFNTALMPLSDLLADFEVNPPHRVRGTAVFMSGNPDGTPPVLLHHLKHNQVLHRQVVLLSIIPKEQPTVPKEEQLDVQKLDHGFFRVVWQTGFMETPNVPQILVRAREQGLVAEPSTTSYFLGRETLLTNGKSTMMRWRKMLFSFVSRNALSATSYFGLPPGRVVELGMQVDL